MPSLATRAELPWSTQPLAGTTTQIRWALQALQRSQAHIAWYNPPSARREAALPWRGEMPRARRGARFDWIQRPLGKRTTRIPWGNAAQLPWIVRTPVEPTPPPDNSPFPPGNRVGLALGCSVLGVPGFAPLNLGVTACYVVRPQRRTYIVLNTVSVVRLPDRTPIEVEAVSITGDAASWAFSVDLTLANTDQLPLLKPNASGPRQVEVVLNGFAWTFVIESYSTARQWASTSVSLTGRSRTALLATPYAPARAREVTEDRSVAQLATDELADTGYTMDYATVDWTVPAGAWYYDGQAPLDAITRLAEASGAVVQSDPEELLLRVRPRYPSSPWDWLTTTPDTIIQDDVIVSTSLQVRSVPLYDAVVVTGEITGKGVTGRIRRAGSAGTLYAEQASDQLINTAAAAAERGRNILGDRGEQAAIDVTLPLFPAGSPAGQPGRVLPLDLVQIEEAAETWHGLCTAVSIAARREDEGLVIEQTITLERHYTDAD